MVLLDTNIVSAVMAPSPPGAVIQWLNLQESSLLCISAITMAEIGYGLAVLPDGKRRRQLEDRFERFVAHGFDQRVVSFDELSARHYSEVMGHRKQMGRPLSVLDGQIAGIARAHRMTLATRNIRDFEECGLELVNPIDS